MHPYLPSEFRIVCESLKRRRLKQVIQIYGQARESRVFGRDASETSALDFHTLSQNIRRNGRTNVFAQLLVAVLLRICCIDCYGGTFQAIAT